MPHRSALPLVVALGLGGCSADEGTPAPTEPSASPTTTGESDTEIAAEVAAETAPAPPPFDLTRHSTADARSPWVVVNERRPLRPPTYAPELDVVEGYLVHPRVVRPLSRLLAAGRRAGLDLRLMSAHRSYGRQADLHAAAVAARGPGQQTTAPAGHSEHQTGLAVDLGRARTGACNVTACFAGTREGHWLGYAHESWHFRFVGRPLASYVRRERIPTLEEAFGLRPAGS